jgi:FkbM family methyltransferase
MILFDIGANSGGATAVGLSQGYKVIALDAAPKIFQTLVKNYIYNPSVIPLKYAVSDVDNQSVEFYETIDTDALSTLNIEWLTSDTMPYNGFKYRTIKANTITIDTLAKIYGEPTLIKIDVEGAEWKVLRGMTKHHGELTLEWTIQTLDAHEEQLNYLYSLGYRKFAPQYIVEHLERPTEWFSLKENNKGEVYKWIKKTSHAWESGGWQVANLRWSADVGMLWVR